MRADMPAKLERETGVLLLNVYHPRLVRELGQEEALLGRIRLHSGGEGERMSNLSYRRDLSPTQGPRHVHSSNLLQTSKQMVPPPEASDCISEDWAPSKWWRVGAMLMT